ncbi:MAG TPA: hypothetical protein P5252_05010 [Candidatus Cloacimonas sp.]|nr:hypothetical protein [Candidatus Cloacimonas sp.]
MNYIPIKLDKTRNMLMGFGALQLFKKITGKSLAKFDYENEDIEDYIPALFFAGLVHEDKELTLEKATELIDEHLGIKGALDLLPQIIEETFGEEEDVKNAQRAVKKK